MASENTSNKLIVDRRELLVSAAGGLLLGFTLPEFSRVADAAVLPQAADGSTAINAWIRVTPDERVTILVGSSEMGQGVMSGLPQIVAEELMVDWSRVRAEHAPAGAAYVNPAYHAQLTGGSMSVRGYYQALRVAGAAAREMLVTAAARQFGIAEADCQAVSGMVINKKTGASLSYGKLAPLAAMLPAPANPALTPDDSLRLIGKSLPRLDLPAKVNGSAVFGIDVRVPGMVYAAIKHCPVLGGTVAKTPSRPTGTLAVVSLGNAVAVVADNTWKAMRAAARLQVSWTLPSTARNVDSGVILTQAQQLMSSGTPAIAEAVGDVTSAPGRALEMTYYVPYLAHACMEVLNCTVNLTADGCEVWAPTQGPGSVVNTVKTITGLDPQRIMVHTTFLGGGLGRKIEQDYIAQAVRIAQAVGRPVKLTWSREEDFGHDQYRPMALARVRATLDPGGNVTGWSNRIVSPSILAQRGIPLRNGVDGQGVEGAINLPYAFGSRLVEYLQHPAPVPVGFWRSVGHSINAFVVESAIDELAAAAGMDPLAFRQRLLVGNPRVLAVLNAAASLAGWGTPLPAGHARGLALSVSFGSVGAQVVEISQPVAGSLKVHRVACAIDCGRAINPNSVEAQMQGGIIHGLSAALWGQVTFKGGTASARNFSNYRMLRMREMPWIDVQVIQSGAAIGGTGEPGVPPVAPALANAYARLTGQRIRSLPFFPNARMGEE